MGQRQGHSYNVAPGPREMDFALLLYVRRPVFILGGDGVRFNNLIKLEAKTKSEVDRRPLIGGLDPNR